MFKTKLETLSSYIANVEHQLQQKTMTVEVWLISILSIVTSLLSLYIGAVPHIATKGKKEGCVTGFKGLFKSIPNDEQFKELQAVHQRALALKFDGSAQSAVDKPAGSSILFKEKFKPAEFLGYIQQLIFAQRVFSLSDGETIYKMAKIASKKNWIKFCIYVSIGIGLVVAAIILYKIFGVKECTEGEWDSDDIEVGDSEIDVDIIDECAEDGPLAISY